MKTYGKLLATSGACVAVVMLVTSFAQADSWRRAARRANRGVGYYTSYANQGYGYGGGSGYLVSNNCGCCPTGYVSQGAAYSQPYQGQQYQGQQYQNQQYQGQYQNQQNQGQAYQNGYQQPYQGGQYSAGRPIYDNVQPQPAQPRVQQNQGNINRNQQYSPPPDGVNVQGGANVQGGINQGDANLGVQGNLQSDLPNADNQLTNPREDGVQAPREKRQNQNDAGAAGGLDVAP